MKRLVIVRNRKPLLEYKGDSIGNVIPETIENLKMCACLECPSHNNSPVGGALCCSRGKSEETVFSQVVCAAFVP